LSYNSLIILNHKYNSYMSEPAIKEDQPITMNAFNDPALAQANKLFISKQFEAAIPLYQKYIEERVDIKTDIDGLGNN